MSRARGSATRIRQHIGNVIIVDSPELWIHHAKMRYCTHPDTQRAHYVLSLERLAYPRARVVMGPPVPKPSPAK